MSFPAVLAVLVDLAVRLDDRLPEDKDVKAGWTAFALFLLLGLAVVVLGFSLVKQLRKAQAAEDAGVYGRDAEATEQTGPTGAQGSTASTPENPAAS